MVVAMNNPHDVRIRLQLGRLLSSLRRGPLYRNSFYIMLTTGLTAIVSFAFWILAARIYSQQEIGIAVALISLLSLLVAVSRFGIDQSLIRFLPQRDRSRLYSSCVVVTTLSVSLFGAVVILIAPLISSSLDTVRSNAPAFLVFLLANSVAASNSTFFVACRKTEYYFLQSLLIDTRLILLLPMVLLGALGIFYAHGFSLVIAVLFSFLLLRSLKIRFSGFDIGYLKDSFRYSAGNYAIETLSMAPALIVPIVVLNTLGPAETAKYYLAYAVAAVLLVIPSSFSMSLFVEGSHGEALRGNARRTIAGVFLLLIPSAVVLVFLGPFILREIGSGYSGSVTLLRLLCLSSLASGVSTVYYSVKRVQKKIKVLVFLSALTFSSLIGLSYFFSSEYGIDGVGYAWLVTYCMICILIGIFVWRDSRDSINAVSN